MESLMPIQVRVARRPRRRSIAVVLALASLAGLTTLDAQPRARDHEVKAVYLLNFGRFARWPATTAAAAGTSFSVCVIGRDPFGPTLDAVVEGEKIGGRRVVARRLTPASDLAGCHIVFIDASEQGQLGAILRRVDGRPTLTVSDMPRFAEGGGMIQFVLDGNRVRFAVNVTATERAGLMLSSELLRVAISVMGGKRPDA
jgi:hypothetical protein